MKFIYVYLFFFLIFPKPVIVFVHLGSTWKEYINVALQQVNTFNADLDIYLICDKIHFPQITSTAIKLIATEDLNKNTNHLEFDMALKNTFGIFDHGTGLFKYASERFFYICDFMQQYKLFDVIHLESDVMVYCDLDYNYTIFENIIDGRSCLGATFDSDDRCVPSILFIKGEVINYLVDYLTKATYENIYDMYAIGSFRKNNLELCLALPIIFPEYVEKFAIKNLLGKVSLSPNIFYKYADHFDSIFDAAAIGQYLGGTDKMHGYCEGFVNETCMFNPSLINISWIPDELDRRVPYAYIGKKKYRINNLHIHSKDLNLFSS